MGGLLGETPGLLLIEPPSAAPDVNPRRRERGTKGAVSLACNSLSGRREREALRADEGAIPAVCSFRTVASTSVNPKAPAFAGWCGKVDLGRRRVKVQAPSCIAPAVGDTRGSMRHREGTWSAQALRGIRRVVGPHPGNWVPRKLDGFHLHSGFVGPLGSRPPQPGNGSGTGVLFFGWGCFEAMRSIEIKPGGSLRSFA